MTDICWRCELPIEYPSVVRHPILGPRHADCGKVSKICPKCHLRKLDCECD